MIPMGKAKELLASSLATAQALMRDPSKTTRPFGIRPVSRGRSRMIESAETDFPEPDSPTIATTSPGSM